MNGLLKYGFLLLACFITGLSFSQNFIGMNPESIATVLKSEYPQFKLDKNAVNHSYKYLKYVDKISEQTILFFLSDDNHCTYIRWMSDYSNLNDMVGMLNRKYKKSGENSWTYADKGGNFSVKLEEEEWYFTVSIRKN
ncbi:MAG TPA: hypothetical protein VHI78_06365 [Bacteroidales bacterium]|jgi:hypothetical protein|nr:hypothetical protein [Bacteroidales bacterium]